MHHLYYSQYRTVMFYVIKWICYPAPRIRRLWLLVCYLLLAIIYCNPTLKAWMVVFTTNYRGVDTDELRQLSISGAPNVFESFIRENAGISEDAESKYLACVHAELIHGFVWFGFLCSGHLLHKYSQFLMVSDSSPRIQHT